MVTTGGVYGKDLPALALIENVNIQYGEPFDIRAVGPQREERLRIVLMPLTEHLASVPPSSGAPGGRS